MASEEIRLGDVVVRFLVDPDESGGAVSVFDCRLAPGARVPVPHLHDAFEETIYGLERVSVWTVDGERREVGPGEALFIPRGAVHGFENPGDAETAFLAIATPGAMTPRYFVEVREAVAASGGGPPDPALIGAVMRRHGLTPVPA